MLLGVAGTSGILGLAHLEESKRFGRALKCSGFRVFLYLIPTMGFSLDSGVWCGEPVSFQLIGRNTLTFLRHR